MVCQVCPQAAGVLTLGKGLLGRREFRFLRIVPEMLGFYSDRSSRIPASIKNLWEATIGIVGRLQHSTRIEPCKKSLGGLALHSIGKNMPRVPKCQFYPSLKMPRVANHPINLNLAIFGFYGFIFFQDLPIKYLYYTKSVLIRPRLFLGEFHPSLNLQGVAQLN